MSFTISAIEEEPLWTFSDNQIAGRVLALFEQNPFGDFNEMDLDTSLIMKPYDRGQIISELAANQIAGISVSTEQPLISWGGITQNQFSDGIYLSVKAEDVSKINLNELIDYLKKWRNVLPKFSWANASADDRDNDFFYDELKILPVPDCIGNTVGWYHVISPRGYEPFFKREDLLNSPAYNIEELDDGTICLMTYSHPLEFNKKKIRRDLWLCKIIFMKNGWNTRRCRKN